MTLGSSNEFLMNRLVFCLLLLLTGLSLAAKQEEEEKRHSPSQEGESTGSLSSVVEFGVWRPGGTFNDPRQWIVLTPERCHEACSASPRCLSWSRDRLSGACALKERESPFRANERFDSGVIDGVTAVGVVPVPDCFTERRLVYRNGDVLRRANTDSADECCAMCQGDTECFSWFRSRSSGRCVMNRNAPPAEEQRRFDGAVLI